MYFINDGVIFKDKLIVSDFRGIRLIENWECDYVGLIYFFLWDFKMYLFYIILKKEVKLV